MSGDFIEEMCVLCMVEVWDTAKFGIRFHGFMCTLGNIWIPNAKSATDVIYATFVHDRHEYCEQECHRPVGVDIDANTCLLVSSKTEQISLLILCAIFKSLTEDPGRQGFIIIG